MIYKHLIVVIFISMSALKAFAVLETCPTYPGKEVHASLQNHMIREFNYIGVNPLSCKQAEDLIEKHYEPHLACIKETFKTILTNEVVPEVNIYSSMYYRIGGAYAKVCSEYSIKTLRVTRWVRSNLRNISDSLPLLKILPEVHMWLSPYLQGDEPSLEEASCLKDFWRLSKATNHKTKGLKKSPIDLAIEAIKSECILRK